MWDRVDASASGRADLAACGRSSEELSCDSRPTESSSDDADAEDAWAAGRVGAGPPVREGRCRLAPRPSADGAASGGCTTDAASDATRGSDWRRDLAGSTGDVRHARTTARGLRPSRSRFQAASFARCLREALGDGKDPRIWAACGTRRMGKCTLTANGR